jgi:hypothetical protein
VRVPCARARVHRAVLLLHEERALSEASARRSGVLTDFSLADFNFAYEPYTCGVSTDYEGQLRAYPWTEVGADDMDEGAIYVRELNESSTGPAWPWPW